MLWDSGVLDHDELIERIDRIDSDRPGLEHGHACEVIAREYVQHGVEPEFPVTSLASFNPRLIVAERFWHLTLVENPRVSTAAACAAWIADHVDWHMRDELSARWGLRFGLACRDRVESLKEVTAAAAEIGAQRDGESRAAFASLFHAGRLRANWNFYDMYRFLDSELVRLAGRHRESAIFIALRGFAALGSRAFMYQQGCELLAQAWAAPDRGRSTVELVTNALCVGRPFPGQGKMLMRYANEAVGLYPAYHAMRYWLAFGYTMTGDHRAALEAIDTALELLPTAGWHTSHQLLREQYMEFRLDVLRRVALS